MAETRADTASQKVPRDLREIEIQSGDYLGEDDIVRFDDVYGRTNNEG